MIQYLYANGKRRVVTFSYDDGHENDKRLIELFNKYSVKGSFHLNGSKYIGKSDEELKEIGKIYEGHEISCHTLQHGWTNRMPIQSIVKEVVEDRKILEKIAGYPVIGMSYPSGDYNENSLAALHSCGIVYSRTVKSTKNFTEPQNFLEWHPSCHHRDALSLVDSFVDNVDSQWTRPMFYIWGHSHELRTEENWDMMERIVKKLANNEKIWYATNIDIYNYMTALKNLQMSVDEKVFYNPTAIDLWVEKDKKQVIHIPAGKRVVID